MGTEAVGLYQQAQVAFMCMFLLTTIVLKNDELNFNYIIIIIIIITILTV